MIRLGRRIAIAASLCVGAGVSPSMASEVGTKTLPVEWIVGEVGAVVDAHCEDGTGYYALGRVHASAYVLGLSEINVLAYRHLTPRAIMCDPSRRTAGSQVKPRKADDIEKLDENESMCHLEEAIRNIERAIERGIPEDERLHTAGAAHLSLGYLLEHGVEHACDVSLAPGAGDWLEVPEAERGAIGALLDEASEASEERRAESEARLEAYDSRRVAVVLRERCGRDDEGVAADAMRRLERYWLELAASHYLASFQASLEGDLAQNVLGGVEEPYRQLVSYEAGASYLRLVDQLDIDADVETLRHIRNKLKFMKNKRYGTVR